MKPIVIIINLLFFFLTSCVNDTGNYTYLSAEDVLPIDIIGLQEDLSVIQGERLQISPNIEKMDDPARYTYIWYVTEAQTAGALPIKRNIGNEKTLDVKINLDAGSYLLNFMVMDEKKDIYKRKQVKLEVRASNISTGWYVLKDQNNETDFDYIDSEGTIYADVLAKGGNQLKGKAVGMSYQSGRYYHNLVSNTGVITKLTNQKVFHVLSTEDIRTFNAQNMLLFKKYEEEFYSLPSVCNPQGVISQNTDGNVFLLNAGKLHSIYGMSPNIGKLSAAKVGEYSLFPSLIPINYFGDVLIFDILKHSFYTSSTAGTSVDFVNDQKVDTTTISLRNMPYEMINMFAGSADINNAKQAFALMKNTEDGTYRIAQIPYNSGKIFNSFNIVPNDAMITQSKVMASPSSGNFVYFAISNKIYYYMNATGLEEKEKLIMTIPENENVYFMIHIYTKKMNVLAVLANTASNWKLYLYPIESVGNPELITQPQSVFTGSGTGRFLIYRDK